MQKKYRDGLKQKLSTHTWGEQGGESQSSTVCAFVRAHRSCARMQT